MLSVKIKERAWIACIAARKLKAGNVAIVIGNTIYLHGVTRAYFLSNPAWLRHELKHVEQYRRLSIPLFIMLYLYQCLRFGYTNAPLELAARQAEADEQIAENYLIT